jgi:hypothetical protein
LTQTQSKRLAGHEFGLRHRARMHGPADNAIDHRQDVFTKPPKSACVPRVYDVDACIFPFNDVHLARIVMPRSFFRDQIHRAFLDALVVTERAGLAESWSSRVVSP